MTRADGQGVRPWFSLGIGPNFRGLGDMCKGKVKLLLLVVLAACFAGSADPAAAAEKSADLDRYCKSRYGRDYVTNIDRRDDGLLCTKSTSGGLGLLHRKVSAADVCQAQHKTRRFRRTGKGLICITGAGGGGQAAKTVDLKKYCKDKYGPQAFVTRRQTDDRPMCTVRTNQGRGLRYYVIDLAGLCGGGAPRVSGTTLECGGSTVAGGGSNGGSGKGQRPPGGPAPPGSAKGPAGGNGGGSKATGSAASGGLGRLRGCGIADRKHMERKRKGIPQADGGGIPSPCPGLSGGKVVDLAKYCREGYKDTPYRKYEFWLRYRDGLPKCDTNKLKRRPKQEFFFDVSLPNACWRAYPGGLDALRRKGLGAAYRFKDRRLTCFYIRLTCAEFKNPSVYTTFFARPRCRQEPKPEKYVEGET